MAIFGLIQAVIFGVLLSCFEVDRNHYLAAIHDKHRWLSERKPPRVVLLGGSSAAFGFDSPRLRDQTGLNPVNMSLTAPLGMGFMLNDIASELQPGDIVILSFEYEHFLEDVTGWRDVMIMLEQRPQSFWKFELQQQKLVFDRALHHMGRIIHFNTARLRGQEPEPASLHLVRSAFNEFGDAVAHHKLPPPKELLHTGPMPSFDARLARREIEKINQFVRTCRKRSIRVFYGHPQIEREKFELNQEQIDQIASLMDRLFDRVPLTRPAETVYGRDEFFDTVYHPNPEVKIKRTTLLAKRLNAAMDAATPSPLPKISDPPALPQSHPSRP